MDRCSMRDPGRVELAWMTPREAVRELAWCSRRARELAASTSAHQDVAAHVELFARKAHVLACVGELELAEEAWAQERAWRAQLVGPLIPQRA